MELKVEEIVKELRNKIYRPVYLLTGDETYYLDKLSDYFRDNVLTEEEKAFNQHILYGKDVTVNDVDNVCRRYPMMANNQLVILKEAQELRKFEDLSFYASNPLKSTILVIEYRNKKLNRNKKVFKEINKNGVVFESKPLYDNQVQEWINNYVRKKSYQIDPASSLLLSESLGNNLGKISNEIDKLIISIGDNTKIITSELIEKNIGISKEFNNFELQNALGQKNVFKVNQIVNYFGNNQKQNPIIVTIISLYTFFSNLLIFYFVKEESKQKIASVLKINPFFVDQYRKAARNYSSGKIVRIISLIREYDLKTKGVNSNNTPPKELLQELCFKIMH